MKKAKANNLSIHYTPTLERQTKIRTVGLKLLEQLKQSNPETKRAVVNQKAALDYLVDRGFDSFVKEHFAGSG